MQALKRTVFYDRHAVLGAEMVAFGGWEMPLHYPTGIVEEHLATRKGAGLFDVSHMSNLWISGKDAEKLVAKTTVEDAKRINPNLSQYTVLLKENGTIIDDTIFMHLDNRYMMIPNAGMSGVVTSWLNQVAQDNNFDASAENVSNEFVIVTPP